MTTRRFQRPTSGFHQHRDSTGAATPLGARPCRPSTALHIPHRCPMSAMHHGVDHFVLRLTHLLSLRASSSLANIIMLKSP